MQWCLVQYEDNFLKSKAGAYDSPYQSSDPIAKDAFNSDMVASSESQLSGPRHTTCDKFFHKVLIDGDELTVSTADLVWLWEQKMELNKAEPAQTKPKFPSPGLLTTNHPKVSEAKLSTANAIDATSPTEPVAAGGRDPSPRCSTQVTVVGGHNATIKQGGLLTALAPIIIPAEFAQLAQLMRAIPRAAISQNALIIEQIIALKIVLVAPN